MELLEKQVALADPEGSVLYNYVRKGELEREGLSSITEGIGQGRVTGKFRVKFKKKRERKGLFSLYFIS